MMSRARTYLLEWQYEFLRLLRSPGFVLPTLTFPAAFYVLFALVLNFSRTFDMSTYLLASYGVFGIIGPALFGFGVGIAIERSRGWMLLKFASPMPFGAYFLAKILMSMSFALIIVLSLYALGMGFGGVTLTFGQAILLLFVLVLGTLPFCAMGLMLGSWVDAQAAPAVVNLIYLPMAPLSGLWFPLQILPQPVQQLAWFLPPFHLNQLATGVLGLDMGYPAWIHILFLLAFTGVFLWLAVRGLQREKAMTLVEAG